MITTDTAILKQATTSAGELSHRKAQEIRRMGYRIPGTSGDYAPHFLADCLYSDHYGTNSINDRFFMNDWGTAHIVKERANQRNAWRISLVDCLRRLSTNDAEWRTFIDTLADGGMVRVYQLGIVAELKEVA